MAILDRLDLRRALNGRLNHLSREFMLFYIHVARFYYPTCKKFRATYPERGFGDVQMPAVPSFYDHYATISTCWHAYNVARAVMAELSLPVVGLFNVTNLPNHCLMMGRVVGLPGAGERVVSGLFSIFHLPWRALQQLFMRPFNISNVFLMFESEPVIEQFLDEHSKPCGQCQPAECTNPNHDLEVELPDSGQLDAQHRYITDILCFECHQSKPSVKLVKKYYLRPNRTRGARFYLRNNLGLVTILNTSFSLGAALVIAAFASWIIAFDSEYIKRYPGCSPDLEDPNRTTTSS